MEKLTLRNVYSNALDEVWLYLPRFFLSRWRSVRTPCRNLCLPICAYWLKWTTCTLRSWVAIRDPRLTRYPRGCSITQVTRSGAWPIVEPSGWASWRPRRCWSGHTIWASRVPLHRILDVDIGTTVSVPQLGRSSGDWLFCKFRFLLSVSSQVIEVLQFTAVTEVSSP